jgi:short-subunit dehydrogenase
VNCAGFGTLGSPAETDPTEQMVASTSRRVRLTQAVSWDARRGRGAIVNVSSFSLPAHARSVTYRD